MVRQSEAGHHKLLLVIPVLFCTGGLSPSPYAIWWLDEFNDPELVRILYWLASPLIDVTVITDDEITDHRSIAALTLLRKHIHQRDLAELVDMLPPILLDEYLSSLQIYYIVQADETSDESLYWRTSTTPSATRRRTHDYRTTARRKRRGLKRVSYWVRSMALKNTATKGN